MSASAPQAVTYAMYPRPPGGAAFRFDMHYYLTSYMPEVEQQMKPCGLQSYTVLRFADDDPSGFYIGCMIVFESAEAKVNAMRLPWVATHMADLEKFTDLKPTIWNAEVVEKAQG